MSDSIRQFVVGPIETNCYAYISEGECLVVDPGASGAAVARSLEDVNVTLVVATHRHHDHVCGVRALVELTGAPWAIGAIDAEGATKAIEFASHYVNADSLEECDPPAADRQLHEGDVLKVGTATFTVIETPGHTEGGICLVGGGSADGICFVGDTLFRGSCGRVDLMGGDSQQMEQSLQRLKRELPPQTTIFCGHGDATTMEEELQSNPFLQ